MIGIEKATVHTMTGDVMDCGTILIRGGQIVEVGKKVDVSENFRLINADGLVIIPGLIDAHSHLGLWEQGTGEEGDDATEITPVQPHLRAIDGINPQDDGFKEAIRGGITSS
jgi:imidazolonepropionase-like amidohydrolase